MSAVKDSSTNERRQQTYQLIAELKSERLEVWTLYCEIANLKPFTAHPDLKQKLNQFCQLVIDYISLGHFGVYERLMSGTERRDRVLLAVKEIFPDLSITTQIAELFNEKYEHLEDFDYFEELDKDLSVLGENLALRSDLEDKLCNLLM